jgi:hypothetical protein
LNLSGVTGVCAFPFDVAVVRSAYFAGQGHSVSFNPLGTSPAQNGPGILITTGNTVANFDASGKFVSGYVTSKTTDVCSLIGRARGATLNALRLIAMDEEKRATG